jgi:hypothetical protein
MPAEEFFDRIRLAALRAADQRLLVARHLQSLR